MFDLKLIQNYYSKLNNKMLAVKDKVNRPLTLSEKILYTHLDSEIQNYSRGKDYVDFKPDRVAMQDATAQMA